MSQMLLLSLILESMTIDYPAVDVALAGARKHLNSFFPHPPLKIFWFFI
jgi:hypothetical protein